MATTLEKRLLSCTSEDERLEFIRGWFRSVRDMAVANWITSGAITSVQFNGIDPTKS